MQLHDTQRVVAKDPTRFRVLLAGRRWGKTVLAVEEMLYKAMTTDNAKVLYLAPTFQAARDIAWTQIKNRLEGLGSLPNEARLDIVVPNSEGGTSQVFLRSWDAVETLRGQAFDFIVLDEVAMYKRFTEGWQQVLLPTLTDKEGGALFISTPRGFNFFYELYHHKGKDWKSFHFRTYDNPHIKDSEIEKLRQSISEDSFAQEYLADFRKQEGLVYKEFRRDMHVVDTVDLNQVGTKFVGVDFGYTNPTAVVHIGHGFDDKYYIYKEMYERNFSTEQLIHYMNNQDFSYCYADPASPEAIDRLRMSGVNVMDVKKGKDSIIDGIQVIRDLFKQNRIKIESSLHNLIFELETYAYPSGTGERNENETPIKKDDHLLDALRYAITSFTPIGNTRPTFEERIAKEKRRTKAGFQPR